MCTGGPRTDGRSGSLKIAARRRCVRLWDLPAGRLSGRRLRHVCGFAASTGLPRSAAFEQIVGGLSLNKTRASSWPSGGACASHFRPLPADTFRQWMLAMVFRTTPSHCFSCSVVCRLQPSLVGFVCWSLPQALWAALRHRPPPTRCLYRLGGATSARKLQPAAQRSTRCAPISAARRRPR